MGKYDIRSSRVFQTIPIRESADWESSTFHLFFIVSKCFSRRMDTILQNTPVTHDLPKNGAQINMLMQVLVGEAWQICKGQC